jgi:hypothetical protein
MAQELARLFYERLFELEPSTERLFASTDMKLKAGSSGRWSRRLNGRWTTRRTGEPNSGARPPSSRVRCHR